MELSDSARTLLQIWKDSYMSTRDKIEQSGKGARWEFDRTRLFPRTDYCILISRNLSEIAVLLVEFENFFGPEIKAVVGDPRKIEEALRKTYLLAKPFIDVEFDPFVPANGKLWAELLERLRKDVQVLEAEAKSFIDEAFSTIKYKKYCTHYFKNNSDIELKTNWIPLVSIDLLTVHLKC